MKLWKMFRSLVPLCASLLLLIVSGLAAFGQATDGVLGSVTEPSGAAMPGVTVTATNPATGEKRTLATNSAGVYVFTAMQPGDYDVSAEMAGFKKTIKHATVEVGRQVTVDFALEVGAVTEAVDVAADVSAINLVDSKVDSIIGASEADVPLNGRSAFELAKLVPGVQVTSYITNVDSETGLSIVGRTAGSTLFTLNGINIDAFNGGGEGMNVAHDAISEFQVSINNNDPSVGMGFGGGAINLVTHSGSNAFHGDFSGYYRTTVLAAYPGLARGVLKPNPTNDPTIAAFNANQTSPPFWREEGAGMLSGRIIKDKLFWSTSVDYTHQENSATFDPGEADLEAFATIGSYPKWRTMQTHRLDWRKSDKNSLFYEYTRDQFGTVASGVSTLPATWASLNRTKGSNASVMAVGWTSILTPNLVSDLRVGVFLTSFYGNNTAAAGLEVQQFAPNAGIPYFGETQINATNMFFGDEMSTPSGQLGARPQAVSHFTYVHGKQTLKFGFSVAPQRYVTEFHSDNPYLVTVFNPVQARAAGISIPTTFNTLADLLQLPIDQVSIGIGPALNPDSFPGHDITWANQLYGFVADSYKATPRLTVNLSLSYVYDPLSGADDRDLARPAVLAQFFQGGYFGKPKIDKTMFSPSLGIAWDPTGNGKTVIRAGTGLYWSTGTPGSTQSARPTLLPVGDGQEVVAGNSITNPKTGKGTLFFSTANANAAAGTFRIIDLVNSIAAIRANLANTILTNANTNFSGPTNYDQFKQGTVSDPSTRPAYTLENTIGVQHQFGNNWLVESNFVWNVTDHSAQSYDRNFTTRVGANCPYTVATPTTACPVLPGYSTTTISFSEGRSLYAALLVSAKKRLSNRVQASVSYTLSRSDSEVLNQYSPLNNAAARPGWVVGGGPPQTLFGSVTVDLPWGFKGTLVNDMQSSPSFAATLTGIDLYGDGTTNDPLPGLSPGCLNVTCNVSDLRKAVANFNANFAGKKDARGTTITAINLPANFTTSSRIITQDFRLSKAIRFKERLNLNLIAECFNIFNISNLSFAAAGSASAGASANSLESTGFGQPTSRLGNFNSSEGPRAFQFGARITF